MPHNGRDLNSIFKNFQRKERSVRAGMERNERGGNPVCHVKCCRIWTHSSVKRRGVFWPAAPSPLLLQSRWHFILYLSLLSLFLPSPRPCCYMSFIVATALFVLCACLNELSNRLICIYILSPSKEMCVYIFAWSLDWLEETLVE